MRASWVVGVLFSFIVITSGCATVRPFVSETPQPRADAAAPFSTGFINRIMMVNGKERRYVVYVPFEYTPNKPWPVIVFLHGAFERGSNGLIQTDVGIGHAIRKHPDRFPCIVVMPQCPEWGWWGNSEDSIDTALAETRRAYNVDASRIYLTGLSMGGNATWSYGARRLDVYAALIPICGKGNPGDAKVLATVPIWAFHGTKDENVPVRHTRKMVEAIQNVQGNIKYTELPDADHNSWDKAYGSEDTIAWLLAQHKK